jgi:uncharacterized protein (UPF0332 family)
VSLHTELLAQAEHLARVGERRSSQASLRRAVSTAYYALFHLLVHEATVTFVAIPALRGHFSRAFEHANMKSVSQAFASPPQKEDQLRELTGGDMVPKELKEIAGTFVDLQNARHDADYNVTRFFTPLQVKDLVRRARKAFQDWESIKTNPLVSVYLLRMLLGKRRSRGNT